MKRCGELLFGKRLRLLIRKGWSTCGKWGSHIVLTFGGVIIPKIAG